MSAGRQSRTRLDTIKLVNAVIFMVLGAIIFVRGLTYGLGLLTYVALGGLLFALGLLRLRAAGYLGGGVSGE